MIFQQHLESLGKENNEKVNKNKQGQKINLVVSEYMKDQSQSSKPCSVALKIIYVSRKIVKL